MANEAHVLRDRLRVEGYDVAAAMRGDRTIDMLSRARVDCVIFDLTTAGKNGFDLCRELRASGNPVPILLLTDCNRPIDGVIGLRLGADDYVRKPVDLEELVARLEAVLRRSIARAGRPASVYTSGRIHANFRTAEVTCDGARVCLSALELQLLRYLVEHRGEVARREELLDKVWGYGALPVTRTVDVRIASLRRKLEVNPAHPELIVTVHGVGYRFEG